MIAPDDLWRHQAELEPPDLDALPPARRHALRVRAALPDTPLPEPFGHDVRALVGEVLAPSEPASLTVIAARQIESTGNVVSGYGEHGLATQLWALAADLRARDAKPGGR